MSSSIKGYKPIKVLKKGGKSLQVTLLENKDGDKIIKKQYNRTIATHRDSFHKEIRILSHLKDYPYTPKLLYVDDNNYTFYETYCGKQVPKTPFYKEKMIERTKELYKKYGLAYVVDGKQEWFVHKYNYCLMNEEIYMIDFGSIKWKEPTQSSHRRIQNDDSVQKHKIDVIKKDHITVIRHM